LQLVAVYQTKKEGSSLAFEAVTVDGQVFEIGAEAVLLAESAFQRSEDVLVDVDGLSALLADEMVMVSLFGLVVVELVSTKFGLCYQVEFLEEFECPVDGGFVDPGILGSNATAYVRGSDVAFGSVKSLQNHDALRG
jgi:hypothetical protein